MTGRFHLSGANPPICRQGARRRIALAGYTFLTLSEALPQLDEALNRGS